MNKADELRAEVRMAKNNLIKASKILLHYLEQTGQPDRVTEQEMSLLSDRIDFLQDEILYDAQQMASGLPVGHSRLFNALEQLKQQLLVEKKIFDQEGSNADRLLDINFRVQEIEAVLKGS